MPRLHCEFNNCACSGHVSSTRRRSDDDQCGICLHGGVWHQIDTSQFVSSRASARTPYYNKVVREIKRRKIVDNRPFVPPLPLDSPRYCECSAALPV